jgi:hypothetical protein
MGRLEVTAAFTLPFMKSTDSCASTINQLLSTIDQRR